LSNPWLRLFSESSLEPQAAPLATWQKGERIAEATVAAILKEIDDLAAAPLLKGSPR
jgi:hypothetical protein